MDKATLVILPVAIVLAIACHKPKPSLAPARIVLFESHCWWSVNRSLLPPDSVAARFQRAYSAVGFTHTELRHQGDTAWAYAGPSPINPNLPGVDYATWSVAYQLGDSTHYRWFVAGSRDPKTVRSIGGADSGDFLIPLCGRIMKQAAIPSVVLREPTGEESLSVWRRRP